MSAQAMQQRYLTDAVTTASPASLIVMLYDRLALDLSRAHAALQEPRALEAAHDALLHAQEIVTALQASLLPTGWDGAQGLQALYVWLYERLVEANMTKDAGPVEDCLVVVGPLQQAWRQAAEGAGRPAVGVA